MRHESASGQSNRKRIAKTWLKKSAALNWNWSSYPRIKLKWSSRIWKNLQVNANELPRGMADGETHQKIAPNRGDCSREGVRMEGNCFKKRVKVLETAFLWGGKFTWGSRGRRRPACYDDMSRGARLTFILVRVQRKSRVVRVVNPPTFPFFTTCCPRFVSDYPLTISCKLASLVPVTFGHLPLRYC